MTRWEVPRQPSGVPNIITPQALSSGVGSLTVETLHWGFYICDRVITGGPVGSWHWGLSAQHRPRLERWSLKGVLQSQPQDLRM